MIIWYVSKYAVSSVYGNPTRQFFFSKYMARKGHDVYLISSRSSGAISMPSLGLRNHIFYEVDGVNGVLLNGPFVNLGFNIKRVYSWLIFELRLLFWAFFKKKERPDVVIVSSLSLLTFLSGIIIKRIFKCKLICEVRDIWPLTIIESKSWSEKNLFIRFLSYVESAGYKKADAIVGTMANLKEHVKNRGIEDYNKVFYIPMGFDPEWWDRTNPAKGKFDDLFNNKIPSGHFIVGYAGSIGFINGVDQIIEAAAILRQKPISFLILGDGPLKEGLNKKVELMALVNVHFLNSVPKEKVQPFLSGCDLLLNPWIAGNDIYRFGVSPNKWIDYMYSGRPIIVPLDGYHNIINEAGCGEFIKANDPQALADTILHYSTVDKAELNEMGEKGREYLREKLNYNVLTDKYLQIIRHSVAFGDKSG